MDQSCARTIYERHANFYCPTSKTLQKVPKTCLPHCEKWPSVTIPAPHAQPFRYSIRLSIFPMQPSWTLRHIYPLSSASLWRCTIQRQDSISLVQVKASNPVTPSTVYIQRSSDTNYLLESLPRGYYLSLPILYDVLQLGVLRSSAKGCSPCFDPQAWQFNVGSHIYIAAISFTQLHTYRHELGAHLGEEFDMSKFGIHIDYLSLKAQEKLSLHICLTPHGVSMLRINIHRFGR